MSPAEAELVADPELVAALAPAPDVEPASDPAGRPELEPLESPVEPLASPAEPGPASLETHWPPMQTVPAGQALLSISPSQSSSNELHVSMAGGPARRTPDNALALAVVSSSTVGEALRRGARYAGLVNDAARLDFLEAGRSVHPRYRVDHPSGPHPFGAQLALAMIQVTGQQFLGERFRAQRVAFRHAAQASAQAEYARIFQVPVAFEQPEDELWVDAALLAESLPRADPSLCAYLDRHLDRLLERTLAEPDFLSRVRRVIGEDLRNGLPDVDVVARRLHMSGRSLQRRLQLSGTSYQKELDRLRHDLALSYLAKDMGLAEVAFLVGFSEPSNFHRAFKRWTGLTPAAWRDRTIDMARADTAERRTRR